MENLRYIDTGAFLGCSDLDTIEMLNVVPINVDTFWVFIIETEFSYLGNISDKTLLVPCGTLEDYQNSDWSGFNIVENCALNNDVLQNANTSTMRAYPNPTAGAVTIDNADSKTHVEVFSANGTFIERTYGNKIDLSKHPAGVYMIKAGSKTARVVKK